MKKSFILGVLAILLFVNIGFASAEFWACFEKGEYIDYCNPNIPDRTASGDNYRLCMNSYDVLNDCYSPGNWNVCNSIGGACSVIGGNSSLDITPPEFYIINPLNGSLHTERTVTVSFSLDEKADVEYLDLINGRGRWTRVCNDCFPGNPAYTRERSFDEGPNILLFKATDVVGNAKTQQVSFYVDSKDPRIRGTEPKKGFANGYFYVEVEELNLYEVWLNYGVPGNYRSKKGNINQCEFGGRDYVCTVNVNLDDYDGMDVEYWFNVTDIVGNSDESKHQFLKVDITPPIINSAQYFQNGRRGEFIVNITEANLDTLEYIDHLDPRGKWKRLCSRTVDGVCNGRVNFNDGDHQVEIKATDEGGLFSTKTVSFFTDSKGPKIKNTEPGRGFANGDFYVEFDEANPKELWLNYGNQITGFRKYQVPLNTCTPGRRNLECMASVSLNDYDGEEISYWFNITDIVGSSDTSKETELDVDISPPQINLLNYTIDGSRVYFMIDITEQNLDVVEYIDHADSSPRWKRLCSRLDEEGICNGRVSLRDKGIHPLDIQVIDEAGNIVAVSEIINII